MRQGLTTSAPHHVPSRARATPRTENRAPSARQWLCLFVLFAASLPAVTTRIYSSDEIQYFAYLRSLWFDHDLSFENEYRYFYERGIAVGEGFHETFLERTTATGRRINFGTIGCAILWAPFYAAGDLAARASGAPVDGYSRPYVAAVAYGSAAYGFLALVFSILSAARLGLRATLAAMLVWLGTPLLFYMYVAPPFSHACSAFGVALFIYTWLRVREKWSARGLMALGAAAALMTMIREQDAFFTLAVAADFLLSQVSAGISLSDIRTRGTAVLTGGLTFAAVFAPQAISYLTLNGHIGPHASVGRKMNWAAPHALQVLFSPAHGLFVWTPLAALALLGLLVPAARRKVTLLLLLMAALQVYVGGSVESWTLAGAFGQRRLVALTAILVIGLAALLQRASRSRGLQAAAIAASLVAVYWNLALSAEFAIGLMDRQKLEPRRNAYDAFVTLPAQAPSLAYRYLFERSSFYRGTSR